MPPEFDANVDEILEQFIMSIAISRLYELHKDDNRICCVPDMVDDVTSFPVQPEHCKNQVSLFTYYRKIPVGYCREHENILVDYLEHPIHEEDRDGEIEPISGPLKKMLG